MFHRWLKENNRQFPYTVCRTHRKTPADSGEPGRRRYFFYGLKEHDWLYVSQHGIQIHRVVDGEETVYDIDIFPTKTGKGEFTCGQCEYTRQTWDKESQAGKEPKWSRPAPEYFQSLDALYADHCFAKLLRWVNENLAT